METMLPPLEVAAYEAIMGHSKRTGDAFYRKEHQGTKKKTVAKRAATRRGKLNKKK